ncbi:DUF6684 family protein [Halalkalirubrum salinum]|uniref:DUF6684 family protein n=1 Tax=Halalkalirubrum salinum TaxID=2563889 RepID=UPI0010FB401F|nr:DUF6684 family protein [Halalkalirubrum salinum]
MESKIFDKETLLDLTVNFIPLGIILTFIAVFAVVSPWGFDIRASGIMYAVMIIMFTALGVLTYLSGKAIAGDEKTKPVYSQGQAFLDDSEPIEHEEADHDVDQNDHAVDETDDDETGAGADNEETDAESDEEVTANNDEEATADNDEEVTADNDEEATVDNDDESSKSDN